MGGEYLEHTPLNWHECKGGILNIAVYDNCPNTSTEDSNLKNIIRDAFLFF